MTAELVIYVTLGAGITLHLLGILSAIDAVQSARTSQGAIAWSVSLLTLPYLAVPAYWVFGRSRFRGYVTARRETQGALAELANRVREPVLTHRTSLEHTPNAPTGRAVEQLAGMPYLNGNAVELLVDGEATFASILAGIDAAESYVLFQFFILKDDTLGRAVQERLIAKAQAGARVYVLYDEVGSHALGARYLRELRAAGVRVSAFNSRKGRRNRFQLNFRNHRKVVVVDGEIAWIGGHNVGDEYMGRDPAFGHWRDTHVRIVGPAALEAQFAFVEDWRWATDEVPELSWTPTPATDGDVSVLVLPSGPADDLETAALMFVHAINSARERIWIASPYFVPDDATTIALQLAALRGVDVRVLIPDKADHLAVYLAAFTYVESSARTGVRFFRYTRGFLHQKVMLIDDVAATVGTANFDNRSFRLNFEITAVIADPDFAGRVARMLEADLADATPMPPSALSQKPFWFRVAARVARLMAPIL